MTITDGAYRVCNTHRHVYTVSCVLCDMETELAQRRTENSEGLIHWLLKILENGKETAGEVTP